jgi:hypothetical protein
VLIVLGITEIYLRCPAVIYKDLLPVGDIVLAFFCIPGDGGAGYGEFDS